MINTSAIINKRKILKLSQRELGRRINKTGQFISLIEQGKSNPSMDTLKEISLVLEIPLTDLIGNNLESYFNVTDSHKFEQYFSTKTSDGMTIDSIRNELIDTANKEHSESITYIENLTNFYTHIESIKHNGAFADIDDIETKINETNIDNFKKVLNPSDLEIALKSLLLTDSINNFLEDPKDIEIQKQLQIVLDYFEVPQGKKLKLNLVDSE